MYQKPKTKLKPSTTYAFRSIHFFTNFPLSLETESAKENQSPKNGASYLIRHSRLACQKPSTQPRKCDRQQCCHPNRVIPAQLHRPLSKQIGKKWEHGLVVRSAPNFNPFFKRLPEINKSMLVSKDYGVFKSHQTEGFVGQARDTGTGQNCVCG